MNLGTIYDDWNLISLGGGLYNIKNVGRGNYMEWYDEKGNWSTYNANNAASDDQFQMSIYVIGEGNLGGDTQEPEGTEPEATEPEATQPSGSASLKNGDQVVIYAPAYNKALSADKVTEGSFYNKGVDITVSGGVVSGYGDAEIWTVTVNNDGTYSFANGGQNIGLADQYSSMNLGAVNDDWNLISLGNGLYNIQNVGRGNYMEWYDEKGNWSTYNANNAATDGQFQLSIYVIGEGIVGGDTQEPEGTEPEATQPAVDSTMVADVRAGVAYKWGINQENKGVMLYFNGAMAKTYYGGTTENIAEAVDVILVASEADGYHISFKDDSGATKYINIVVSGTYRNFTIADQAETVYTWNKEYCTLVANVDGTECYIGTYGTFDTFSISSIDKIGTSFPSHFYLAGEAEEPDATEPEPTEPEVTEPSTGAESVTYTFSDCGVGTQYTTGETYELDNLTSLYLVGGHMNSQLRMYDDAKGDAQAIFTCAKEISSVVINAGHRAASLEVYASVDGETWVLIETIATERIDKVAEYPDYTVEIPAGYKYLKLDAVGAQVRIPYMIFSFAA